MKDFLRLTELANNIMETGNMDIYQETYEMINLKVRIVFCIVCYSPDTINISARFKRNINWHQSFDV